METVTFARGAEAFRVYCRSRGLAPRTLEIHGEALAQLKAFLGGPDVHLPSVHELRAFTVHLFDKGLAPTTVSIRLRAIRAFLNFLVRDGLLEANPMANVPLPKVPRQFPRVLTQEQVTALVKACDRDTWAGVRNRAMVLVFVDCGLRLGELIGLDVADVDLIGHRIQVRHAKGGKERAVFFGSTAFRALRRWASVRGYAPDTAPFFPSRDGGRLDRRNVQRILERLAKRAGLNGVKVSPHRLRHTAATLFVAFGGPLPALKELLGHSTLRSTEVYLHMAGSLREIHAMASPADRLFGR
ncbi:MAG: tyrosine-type recombinase/integrase [Candidatus Bipolaricaulota bacterium]